MISKLVVRVLCTSEQQRRQVNLLSGTHHTQEHWESMHFSLKIEQRDIFIAVGR